MTSSDSFDSLSTGEMTLSSCADASVLEDLSANDEEVEITPKQSKILAWANAHLRREGFDGAIMISSKHFFLFFTSLDGMLCLCSSAILFDFTANFSFETRNKKLRQRFAIGCEDPSAA